MSSTPELFPCPFGFWEYGQCRPEKLHIVPTFDASDRKDVERGYVECLDCLARGPVVFAPKGELDIVATDNWNRRHSDFVTVPVLTEEQLKQRSE